MNWKEGIKKLQLALSTSEELGHKDEKKHVLYELSDAYFKMGNITEAYEIIKKATALVREIFNAETANRFAMQEVKHVVEQKELIKNNFNCTYRGKIDVKNKGFVEMYYVEVVYFL